MSSIIFKNENTIYNNKKYQKRNKLESQRNKIKEKQITAFIKEISTTLLTKNTFDKIVFNESNDDKNNNKSNILCKEVLYVFQIILDKTEALNKFYEINKDMIFQKIKELFDKRKEIEIDLIFFIILFYFYKLKQICMF